MAALLRQGARRIGGSLHQRTQAAATSPAVAEERRRLLPRRMYGTQETELPLAVDSPVIKALMESTKVLTKDEVSMICAAELQRIDNIGLRLAPAEHLRPRPTKDLEDVMCLIQERKEELYDLISSMEGTHGNEKNIKLLKFLSVQVKPRPDDSKWRRMRAIERMKDAARATVLVSGLAGLWYLLFVA